MTCTIKRQLLLFEAVIAHEEVEDCLVSLSMVGRLRKCETFSGFLYGLFLLLPLTANCSGDILNQTRNMLNVMRRNADELFNESFKEHELHMHDCKGPYPNSSHPHVKDIRHRLNQTLEFFRKAFDVLLKRHTDEYNHTKKLESAKKNIEGLSSNLGKVLEQYKLRENLLDPQTCEMLKTTFDLPKSNDIYQQKLECCRLINLYINFLTAVHDIISKVSRRSRRHTFLLFR